MSPVIAVPVGREVELIIKSQDVTHSFFVRELRLKQDAVPGMEIHMHFTAETPAITKLFARSFADWDITECTACSVMSEADFEKWLRTGSGKPVE